MAKTRCLTGEELLRRCLTGEELLRPCSPRLERTGRCPWLGRNPQLPRRPSSAEWADPGTRWNDNRWLDSTGMAVEKVKSYTWYNTPVKGFSMSNR